MRFWPRKEVGAAEEVVLSALLEGWTLKSHRTLDGHKEYRLHALNGPSQVVDDATVARLTSQGFVQSNLKFPAATYLLTPKGHAAALYLRASNRR